MTDDELKELVASLAVSNAALTVNMNKTDAQIKLTSHNIKRISETVGSITNITRLDRKRIFIIR